MASSFKVLFFLFQTLIIHFSLITAQPFPIYNICNTKTNYRNGSIFQSNLNLLLSSFSSINGNQINNGFFNNTMGRDPDKVYGLFSCRGDVTTEMCKKCVQAATMDIKKDCPTEKEAIIWYDDCLLRYSNQSIFSKMQISPGISLFNQNNATDTNRFRMVLTELMNGLVSKASISSSKFSTGEENLNSSSKMYGLVQCTPDLSSSDCKECLKNATSVIPSCCDGKQGGRVLQQSCHVRYEVYPFYRVTIDHSPASAPSLPPTPSISPTMEPVNAPVPLMTPTSSIQPPSLTPPVDPSTPSIQSPSPPPSINPTPNNDNGKNACNIALTIVIPLVIALILTGQADTRHLQV